MNLIVYQMMQLQIMHVADGRLAVKRLAGTSVAELNFTVAVDRNALPYLSVVSVIIQILHNFRKQDIFVFLFKILPLAVDIVVGKLKCISDIHLGCTVEYRRADIESERHRRKAQMDLKDLSDVHS